MNIEQFFTPYECQNTLPGKKVVVLAPHPDDEVFGCGGTLSQMAAAGAEIDIIIITDGVLRNEWPDLDSQLAEQKRQAKAEQRRQESIQAAEILGYPAPTFMGLQDGELLQHVHLSDELGSRLAAMCPDLILAPSIWEMHRDHRAVAQAALSFLLQATDCCQLAFYEVGVPLIPNLMVDISDNQNRKDQAMQCFGSQLEAQAYADQIRGLNRFRSYTLGQQVFSAEAFHLVARMDASLFTATYRPDHHTLALMRAEQAMRSSGINQLEELKQALEESQQNMDAIKRTLSWRITAPLRAIKSHWRKIWKWLSETK